MWENPLPESCAMLFTTLCTGWILKQRTRTHIFAQQCQTKKRTLEEKYYQSPPHPDQLAASLFKGVQVIVQ